MPSAPIPFVNQQATGLSELAGAPGVATNVFVDQAGAIRRRPGLGKATGVTDAVVDPTGIIGVHATVSGKLYAVGNYPSFRQLYAVGPAFATPLSAPLTDGTLAGPSRPIFAETQLILAIAGGDAIEKIVLGPNLSARLGGNPPYASHVAANSSRLLANIAQVSPNVDFDKSVVRFSGIANGNSSFAGLETWTEGFVIGGAGHFSAEANPDPVLAVHENTNEVFCFGTTSLQIFSPDPFVSDTGIPAGWSPTTTKELGCVAPYSVIKFNQEFAWLDNFNRFVMSDGRGETVISDAIQQTLDQMPVVSDCFGYRVLTGALDALVWTFPSDGRTFAFQKGSGWSEWLGWENGNYAPMSVLSSCIHPVTRETIVGTKGGRVGRCSLAALDDFGAPINARVDTGYLNRGTDAKKHCRCVRVALRRGQSTSSVGPVALISWRDQPGPFGPPLEVKLGAQGDTHPVVELRSLGSYRRRQWRFEFSGSEPLDLVSVTEEFDVLD